MPGSDYLVRIDGTWKVRAATVVCLADAPPPDDLYTYEAPRIAAWEHPALGSDVPACVRAPSSFDFAQDEHSSQAQHLPDSC